jgi:hypothetical protein
MARVMIFHPERKREISPMVVGHASRISCRFLRSSGPSSSLRVGTTDNESGVVIRVSPTSGRSTFVIGISVMRRLSFSASAKLDWAEAFPS